MSKAAIKEEDFESTEAPYKTVPECAHENDATGGDPAATSKEALVDQMQAISHQTYV